MWCAPRTKNKINSKGQRHRNRGLPDPCHSVRQQPPNISELSQAACLAPFPSHIQKGIHPIGNMQTLPNQQVTQKSLCSLAIKTDKQPMFMVDFPWLPGSRPAVLAAKTLSSSHSALCLEILFQPALGPRQREPGDPRTAY